MTKVRDSSKQEAISDFLNKNKKVEYGSCAEAHREFEKETGIKARYVYFNRFYRKIHPLASVKKKKKPVGPPPSVPKKPPKYKTLKSLKREIKYRQKQLKDNYELLDEQYVKCNNNDIIDQEEQKRLNLYNWLVDRDRKALINCYEKLVLYYETQFLDDIKAAEKEMHKEDKTLNYETYDIEEAAKLVREAKQNENKEFNKKEIKQIGQTIEEMF